MCFPLAVAALSQRLSTAALDKHPQARERGMTIDLGFSSFTVPYPINQEEPNSSGMLQFTLVDCPGHAVRDTYLTFMKYVTSCYYLVKYIPKERFSKPPSTDSVENHLVWCRYHRHDGSCR